MKENERKEVAFAAEMSASEHCACDACHAEARVLKISLPYSKYYGCDELATRYREYWLCQSCRKKLMSAVGVVRCADCKWASREMAPQDGTMYCGYHDQLMWEFDYCSYGEARGGGTE